VRAVLHSSGFRGEHWLHDAMVVVSDLVTNAVSHGGGAVCLDLQAHEGHMTIGAADGSSVVPRRRDADDEGGRGMAILEALVMR
jgi:anti-sigma regulatory factor (Ser/Thr protein kinase)